MQMEGKMILLNDILNFPKDQLKDIKIRFNQSNGDDFDPITFFKEKNQRLYDGQFWNYSKAKSFKVGQIAIGFVKIETNKWLLFDISEITKDLEKYETVGYEYRTLEEYRKYFGRLIVGYANKSQNLIRKAESVIDECKVMEIIDDVFEGDVFPGYENVNISWHELKRIIAKKDWKTALENQKGIYLITDISTGKRYVGSASGKDMLLGRWRSYVDNGHGENIELKGLSFEYIKANFRYSVLDIYKSTTDDGVIKSRESYWKRVLLTRDMRFGYNKN